MISHFCYTVCLECICILTKCHWKYCFKSNCKSYLRVICMLQRFIWQEKFNEIQSFQVNLKTSQWILWYCEEASGMWLTYTQGYLIHHSVINKYNFQGMIGVNDIHDDYYSDFNISRLKLWLLFLWNILSFFLFCFLCLALSNFSAAKNVVIQIE